eukprot:2362031-Rhodomonas_salina.1
MCIRDSCSAAQQAGLTASKACCCSEQGADSIVRCRVPFEIVDCKNIENVQLGDNPITFPPKHVCAPRFHWIQLFANEKAQLKIRVLAGGCPRHLHADTVSKPPAVCIVQSEVNVIASHLKARAGRFLVRHMEEEQMMASTMAHTGQLQSMLKSIHGESANLAQSGGNMADSKANSKANSKGFGTVRSFSTPVAVCLDADELRRLTLCG